MAVERAAVGRVDVEREHQHRHEAAGHAHGAQRGQVAWLVAAAGRGRVVGLHGFFQLGATLHQRQAQEQEDGDGQQPVGQVHVAGQCPRADAQRVQRGQQQHVEQRDALPAQRVAQRERGVDQQRGSEGAAYPDGQREGDEDHGGADGHRGRDAHGARRQRPQALEAVRAVVGQVQQVVDEVGGRGAEPEGDEGDEQGEPQRRARGVRRQQGHEQQAVLGPLLEANRAQHGLEG